MKRRGDNLHALQGRVQLGSLDLADVIAVEAGQMPKFFLRDALLFSKPTDS